MHIFRRFIDALRGRPDADPADALHLAPPIEDQDARAHLHPGLATAGEHLLVVHVIARLQCRSLPGALVEFLSGPNKGRCQLTDSYYQAVFSTLTDDERAVIRVSKDGYVATERWVGNRVLLVVNLDPVTPTAPMIPASTSTPVLTGATA